MAAASLVPSFFSLFQSPSSFQFRSSKQPVNLHCCHKANSLHISFRKKPSFPLATSQEQSQYTEYTTPDEPESVIPQIDLESKPGDGKPGFISFYNLQTKTDDIIPPPETHRTQERFLWFAGPAVLVASFILPPIYLRRIVSAVFEDSLLTDFLILFFTEAIFYCGVAGFLLILDRSRRSGSKKVVEYQTKPSQLGERISSVTTLVLSLMIPMVTMGFVWPWTGPAASATLAPYLVGIVVQFAFEQYSRYRNSPSSPVIPIIFQVYRLHQLNRAAQLVTALSFTVKGAEATANNLAIKKSLGSLLNVIQVLGIISIWSISSFLMWLSSSSLEQN